MEENEIEFIIKHNGKNLSVDCNIEDNLNKIEDQEITALIIKLINIGIGKMSKETFSQVEDEEEREIILKERTENFIKAEIFQILDYLDYLESTNEGKERHHIDYNLNVFKKNKDQKLSIESYNYKEISAKEIITSNYLIYKDLADKMLKENNDKENVKEEIGKILRVTEKSVCEFIDKSTQNN